MNNEFTEENKNYSKIFHTTCLILILIFVINFFFLIVQEIYILIPNRIIIVYYLLVFSFIGFLLSILYIILIFNKSIKNRFQNIKYNKKTTKNELYNKILIVRQISNNNNNFNPSIFNINSPKICPICGISEIAGTLRINNIHSRLQVCTIINVCSEHLKLKIKEKPSIKDWIYVIFLFLSLIIFSTLAIITKNQFYLVFAFTLPIIFAILFIIPLVQNPIKNSKIKKFIYLEAFDKGIIISVKNNEWFYDFKKYNQDTNISDSMNEGIGLTDSLLYIYRKMHRIFILVSIILIIVLPLIISFSSYIGEVYSFIIIMMIFIILSFLVTIAMFIRMYIINRKLYNFTAKVFYNL
ncbi:MAG: hypothetical protein ACTSR8_14375 [Promethearchaeota archaeon]